MKRNLLLLKRRGNRCAHGGAGEAAGLASSLPAALMPEVERILWQAAARTPAVLRKELLAISEKGERICPALFLLITSSARSESRKSCRLAASLEALHLALETHRDLAGAGDPAPKKAILFGDFFFGLALTLAGNEPLFIQGMSEVITRFTASVINMPEHPAEAGDCKEHLERICNGSASIFALSCSLGAAHGGLKPEYNEALAHYGLYLGISLQLKGEVENCKQSLREREPLLCCTLPLIYTLDKSPLRKKLVQILGGSPSDREYKVLLEEIRRVNPWPYAEKIIDGCLAKARLSIERLPEMEPSIADTLKSYLC